MFKTGTRRTFLKTATLTASGLMLASNLKAQESLIRSRADFERYIGIFNLGDSDEYGDYYHDDAVMERGDLRLEGKQAILAFYRDFHANVDQHIEVLDFLLDGDRMAVELMASFAARSDWSHPFAGVMVKGQKRRANTFVHYNLREEKFIRIRSARFAATELA